jgi:prolyl-tRNA editing enzyme YbaK/EbsC (Cys-tRNA(Pro) deacylase)
VDIGRDVSFRMNPMSGSGDRFGVLEVLEAAGVSYRIREHGTAAFTSEAAAQERDVRLSQIVKVILLRPRANSDEILVAVLPGDRRLEWPKLKALFGGRGVTFLEQDAIVARLGLVPGAISPLHPNLAGLPMVIDSSLLEEESVDLSSGSLDAGVEIQSAALLRMLPDAEVADVSSATGR